ncbi:MAG: cyclic nucleotide-binding domain-containing protein [Nitrospirae bacterium]|nr:cyclic nucleotide-binding domain-containing protein [Nitrospirota bacterium]MBF0542595.1 cyclic nucleotide-binding domain-containing protein [Nitrospirota bacterium]
MSNKQNILIVSNRPDVREMTSSALRYMGFDKIYGIALNRDSVYDTIEKLKIDLAIVDNNGFKIRDISQFRRSDAEGETQGIKIILLVTTKIDIRQLKEGYKVGISSMLNYPIQMNELQKAVKDAFRSIAAVEIEKSGVFKGVREIDFFSFLTDEELMKLLKMCKCRNYRAGEVVFEQGDAGDRFYVIINGQIDIIKIINDSNEETLATIGKGQCFGEMAILDDSPRSASARAGADTLMFELDKKIMDGYDDIITLKLFKKLGFIFLDRLRNADKKIKELMVFGCKR